MCPVAAGAGVSSGTGQVLLRCTIPAPLLLAPGAASLLRCSIGLASGAVRISGAGAPAPVAGPYRVSVLPRGAAGATPHLLATLAGAPDQPRMPIEASPGLGGPFWVTLLRGVALGTATTRGAPAAGEAPPAAFAAVCAAAAVSGQQGGGFLCAPAVADACLQLGALLARRPPPAGPAHPGRQPGPRHAAAAAAAPPELRVPSAIGAYWVGQRRAPRGGRGAAGRAAPSAAPAAAAALGGALPGGGALSSYRLTSPTAGSALCIADLTAALVRAGRAGAAQAAPAAQRLLYRIAWQADVASARRPAPAARACGRSRRVGVRWAAAGAAGGGPRAHAPAPPGACPARAGLGDLAFLQTHVGAAGASVALHTRGHPAQGGGPVPVGGRAGTPPGTGPEQRRSDAAAWAAAAWALARVAASEPPRARVVTADRHAAAAAGEQACHSGEGDAFGTLYGAGVALAPRLLPHEARASAHVAAVATGGGMTAVAGGLGGEPSMWHDSGHAGRREGGG